MHQADVVVVWQKIIVIGRSMHNCWLVSKLLINKTSYLADCPSISVSYDSCTTLGASSMHVTQKMVIFKCKLFVIIVFITSDFSITWNIFQSVSSVVYCCSLH